MNIANNLQKVAFFQGLNSEDVDKLAIHCHQKKYSKNQQLFEAGDKAESFFIILQGWVKLSRISRNGEEVIIHVFGPGESFAEAAVFGKNRMYPVDAHAVSDVTVIEIPRYFFIQQIENNIQFALSILASISSHQHYLVGQLEQVTTRSAPQRVGAFLLRFCQKKDAQDGSIIVDLPYDKSLISKRLNIKPETFSRALSKLSPYGVQSDGHCIIIRDMKALSEFCDCIY
ncbi:MAG: Crp/Fnr family transcriptional regulator [Alphaproteobacteria bacterium]|nr:Crp/Fnr family transcriptional regulator [Alphaproteobacteria bacterium]